MKNLTGITQEDRGVSVAVTHVLTVGITAILISGLLLGSSSMLETQQERSTESALETIGERLASEISSVNNTAGPNETVLVNTSHQRQVGGSQYTVTLNNESACSDSDFPLVNGTPCVVLESYGQDVTVAIPLSESIKVDGGSSVTGGGIMIKSAFDAKITLENEL